MKQFLLSFLSYVLFTSSALAQTPAQSIEKAKGHLKANQLTQAKTLIDEVLKTPTSQKNAEAWYTKAKVYNAIATDAVLSKQFPAARMEAFKALKKYTETDDKMLIALQIDGYKPVNEMYTAYYQEGANNFNTKQYSQAYEGFTHAILVSSFMNEKGWIKMPLDTNSVLYAGVAAEKLKRYDDAAKYYGQLVEAKVKGDGFVEIYKWVANHYFENKNTTLATKYLNIGKEVYPADAFWNSLEIDMTRNAGNKDALFAQYEKTIAADPNNHLYRYNYAVELYQHAYNTDLTKRPANSEALIEKAAQQVKATIQLKPDYARAQLFAGQVVYNQGVDILSASKKITGTAAADVKNKSDLKTKALGKFDEAMPYFQAVERLLEPQAKLKLEDKTDLKEAYDLLITIYDQKGLKDQVKEYEVKFNDVDKKH